MHDLLNLSGDSETPAKRRYNAMELAISTLPIIGGSSADLIHRADLIDRYLATGEVPGDRAREI